MIYVARGQGFGVEWFWVWSTGLVYLGKVGIYVWQVAFYGKVTKSI